MMDAREALAGLEQFYRREGEDSNDAFERVAGVFYAETGYLRPGKDCRLSDPEDRQGVWDKWVASKVTAARAALAAQPAASGEAPKLPPGWKALAASDILRTVTVTAPNGYSAVTTNTSRNPENVLRMLVLDLLAAHPPVAPEPDMRHPKIQRLIGAKARREIELQLVEQLLEDPECDLTSLDMEYWGPMHDRLKAALTAPEPVAALTDAIQRLMGLLREAYDAGDSYVFGTDLHARIESELRAQQPKEPT